MCRTCLLLRHHTYLFAARFGLMLARCWHNLHSTGKHKAWLLAWRDAVRWKALLYARMGSESSVQGIIGLRSDTITYPRDFSPKAELLRTRLLTVARQPYPGFWTLYLARNIGTRAVPIRVTCVSRSPACCQIQTYATGAHACHTVEMLFYEITMFDPKCMGRLKVSGGFLSFCLSTLESGWYHSFIRNIPTPFGFILSHLISVDRHKHRTWWRIDIRLGMFMKFRRSAIIQEHHYIYRYLKYIYLT